jgi:predicted DNA-binding transcriptional regulator AlpA
MALRKPKRRTSATTPNKADPEQDDDALIGGREVRHLLNNCSEMHVWRLLNFPAYAKLRFPKAIKINTRNYWRRRDVLDWIAVQEAASRRAAA